MTEPTTQQYLCRDCGSELTKKPGGGKPTYCAPCAAVRRLASAREYQRRRRSGASIEPARFPCADCGTEVVWNRRGSQAERCSDCREAHHARYHRAYRANRGHRPVGSVITVACACGRTFEHTVVLGRTAWKCRPCLDLAYAAKKRRDSDARRLKAPPPDLNRTCIDCGACFMQEHVVSRRVHRCRSCAAKRAERLARQYSNAMCAALREATRVTYEVEGRWSNCLGCGSRLSCERGGPVRKWCEGCLPGRRKAVAAAWKLANPEAWRAIQFRGNAARRARLASVQREPYNRNDILERDKWVCQICKKRISKKLRGSHRRAPSIDHQIPLELGGPDTPANVVAAHFGCNAAKRSRYLPQGEQLALIG